MTMPTSTKAKPTMTGKFLATAAAIGLLLASYDSDTTSHSVVTSPESTAAALAAIPISVVTDNGYSAKADTAIDGPVSGDMPIEAPVDDISADPFDIPMLSALNQPGEAAKTKLVPDDPGSAAKNQRTPRDKMSASVAALLAAGAGGDAELVVRYDQRPELFDDEYVNSLGGEVVRSYVHLNMRAIKIPVTSLELLASDDNVDWLSIDDEMSATSLSSRQAANLPVTGSSNGGYEGTDIGIAVLDSGVSQHPDLDSNILQYSFVNGAYPVPTIAGDQITAYNDGIREDKFGHGTHVAGVLSGQGSQSGSQFKGSASGAKVLALQVLDRDGGGSMSDVMAALDWLLTYGSYFDVRVVNLSLGKGISESNTTDPLVLAVERLWDAGFVVVVAAGNDGYSGSMTVNSPGNSRKVITVGSLTDNATGTDFSDDYVSSFSSQGPTIGDYVLKPDLVAPGNRIVAAIPSDSKLAIKLSSRLMPCLLLVCSGDHLEMSGTSMATPFVTAAVARMLDKDPSLTPATVKARLMRSARKIDADPSESGAGLLDIDAALNDAGVVSGEALSPLMIFDDSSNTVLVEDTATLWGDDTWGAAYLFNNGLNWASGAQFTDASGVTATGYMWTDGGVSAKGYMWTDGGVSAKGYMWTDGVEAKSLLDGDESGGFFLNDDQ